jgi:hypothetical protein
MPSSASSSPSTNRSAEDVPVVERDDRDRATRQARVSEKTGSALKPPGSIPAPPGPVSGRATRQPAHAAPAGAPEVLPPLLGKSVSDSFRKRMRENLAGFVDNPGDAVAGADALLADAITQLNDALNKRREELSRQRQSNIGDTEQLRQTLLRYRTALESLTAL